ncbi:UNVERIFIED_CONTAM: hypothetical protein GTU68_062271 [Idotea baltica]|nr:hypothetical protein [Idotea baltica]
MISINNREIGSKSTPFIIAEIGVNHNGSFDLACRMVDEAVLAGADAVKFQTFRVESNTNKTESQFEMLKRFKLSEDEFVKLKNYCESKNIIFISSPFDIQSIDFLDSIGVLVFKVPSCEITNTLYLEHMASKGRPIFLSTGVSTLSEVKLAQSVIESKLDNQLIILHCVSSYPTPFSQANLLAINTLKKECCVPVGYSDHTLGIDVAIGSVALGACVIEKHFTLDRTMEGPDHKASIEPSDFAKLVKGVKDVFDSLGNGIKEPQNCEKNTGLVARKSIFLNKSLSSGEVITLENICFLRPGTGIQASEYKKIIGKKVNRTVKAKEMLSLDMLG